MKLLSVNVGLPREVNDKGRIFTTGIFKSPVPGRIHLRQTNLDGDRQADLKNHGGEYKAVYAYPHENYALWAQELGRDDFSFGQFGENFTIEGLTEDRVHIGDVFRIGGALVEVTQPRVPCYKLGYKMGMPEFVKLFLKSGRSGFYLRVLEEGEVGAGDAIEQVQIDPARMTVRYVNHLLFFDKGNIAEAKRAMNLPALAPGWRESFREIVEAAE